MSNQPIGIFDSGVGGLTVMAAVRKALPNESIIYLGDTARVPYGTKSAETILRYTEECLAFLAGKNVKAIVIACNSASAHALPYLQHKFHLPLLGVIEAGVEAALRVSRNKKIGVIGTAATINSDVYAKELKRRDETAAVTGLACPLFVPLVEEGWLDHPVAFEIAQHYLKPLAGGGIDTLILGCTHYPLLKNVIQKVVGDDVDLIDSAESVAAALQKILTEKKMPAGGQKPFCQLTVTDQTPSFEKLARRFLGEEVPAVKRIVF
ncbi:MAG: glutamate racemase [Deltaproteobacteria bacterium]|nr:glutamate racemase [Deltaproteobacteria bacterium]MBI4224248.1 glutamate racemase [Deltaproteobacteria bacterium]